MNITDKDGFFGEDNLISVEEQLEIARIVGGAVGSREEFEERNAKEKKEIIKELMQEVIKAGDFDELSVEEIEGVNSYVSELYDDEAVREFEEWKEENKQFYQALICLDGTLPISMFYGVVKELQGLFDENGLIRSVDFDDAVYHLMRFKRYKKIFIEGGIRLSRSGKEKECDAIAEYFAELHCNTFCAVERSLVKHYVVHRSEWTETNSISCDLLCSQWGDVAKAVRPKMPLWMVAFFIHPFDTEDSDYVRRRIMRDLYDVIDGGLLEADTNPYRVEGLPDKGQSIDYWGVHIKDFKKAGTCGYLPEYMNVYVKSWEYFLKEYPATKTLGRYENPNPFLCKEVHIKDSEGDLFELHKKISALRMKKYMLGETPIFSDISREIVEVNEGVDYCLVDALDAEVECTALPYLVDDDPDGSKSDKKERVRVELSEVRESGNEKTELVRLACEQYFKKFGYRPTRIALWENMKKMLPSYEITYQSKPKMIFYIGAGSLSYRGFSKIFRELEREGY